MAKDQIGSISQRAEQIDKVRDLTVLGVTKQIRSRSDLGDAAISERILVRKDGRPHDSLAAQVLGALVFNMDRKAGFDLLVVTPDANLIVEIKDPAQQRWWLTTNEVCTRRAVESAGGAYYIVETLEEMVGLVRNDPDVIRALLEKGDRS